MRGILYLAAQIFFVIVAVSAGCAMFGLAVRIIGWASGACS